MGLLDVREDRPITRAEVRAIILDISGALLAASRAISETQAQNTMAVYAALGDLHSRTQAILNRLNESE